MNEGYLQVIVSQTSEGDLLADSANGESLARGSRCIAFFSGDADTRPLASDYFSYLDNQGWQLVSSSTFQIWRVLYTFRGGSGYKIRWEGDRWYGKEKLPIDVFEDW